MLFFICFREESCCGDEDSSRRLGGVARTILLVWRGPDGGGGPSSSSPYFPDNRCIANQSRPYPTVTHKSTRGAMFAFKPCSNSNCAWKRAECGVPAKKTPAFARILITFRGMFCIAECSTNLLRPSSSILHLDSSSWLDNLRSSIHPFTRDTTIMGNAQPTNKTGRKVVQQVCTQRNARLLRTDRRANT